MELPASAQYRNRERYQTAKLLTLKRDFAGDLHDARINSGGGEGAIGRRCRRDGADDRSKLSGIGRVRHWIGEIGMVEDVIGIGADLEVEPFI